MCVSLSLLGPSHPTSCCSAAEIMAVLFFHTMRYKALDPRNPHSDRFVLSKVGAWPTLGWESGALEWWEGAGSKWSPRVPTPWCRVSPQGSFPPAAQSKT